jgi:P pilus assembly chaperone PapD
MHLKWRLMMRFRQICGVLLALCSSPVLAGTGDLLVAPTRIVFDGARGTEVILNNIGDAPATYRVSLELRRMNKEGMLDDVAVGAANDIETKTIAMISYAPRRIVLVPNQPQAIRIGLRAPQGLPDGEYRAHMLFRAIPAAKPVTAPSAPASGLSIALTPIYGVTIPVIIRQGALKAVAGMSDARLERTSAGGGSLVFKLTRTGTRSTFGRIKVFKQGQGKPLFEANGIAVYPEVNERKVSFELPPELITALTGPVTIQYVEDPENGGKTLAELQTVLR